MQKRTLLVLILIVLFAIFIRVYNIYPNNIIFGYDQVEDLFVARKIVDYHDLVVVGRNATGLEGLRHGALPYYFMAIPYFLGKGNPMVVAYWYSFFICYS